MRKGGFKIKFDGKVCDHCYLCKFDYDEWEYVVNNKDRKPIPKDVKKIEIVINPE